MVPGLDAALLGQRAQLAQHNGIGALPVQKIRVQETVRVGAGLLHALDHRVQALDAGLALLYLRPELDELPLPLVRRAAPGLEQRQGCHQVGRQQQAQHHARRQPRVLSEPLPQVAGEPGEVDLPYPHNARP